MTLVKLQLKQLQYEGLAKTVQ